MYKNFDEVVAAVKQREIERTVAIAGAHDAPVVEAALRAEQQDIAIPIFVGHGEKIKDILRSFDRNPSDYNIIDSPENTEAQTAVDLVKDGSANVLMKGLIETRDMLHPVVAKANDLRTGKLMSHVVFFSNVPNYHKLLVATDGGMVMYPTLEEKVGIVENAVEAMRKMGYKMPRVAVLAAIEKVNPKMRATVEAAELKRMNREGLIQHCIVEDVTSFHSDSLCYPLVVCFHDLRKIVVRYDFFGNVHSRTFYIKAHMRTPILKNPGGCIRTDSAAPVFRLLLIVSADGIEKVTLFRKKFRRSSDFSFCSQTYPKKAIQYD